MIGVPELILAAITILTPLVSAVAIQSKWDPKMKNAVAFGISLVLAVGYLLLTGGIADWTDVPAAVLAVYGLQQLVYKQFLHELSKRIEAVTDINKGEKVVVAEGEANQVVETGGENAEVVIVDDAEAQAAEINKEEVLPNYQAGHRGDQPVG